MCWGGMMVLTVFPTLTSILSLGEGEEEKIWLCLHVPTFSAPLKNRNKFDDDFIQVSEI